MDESTNLENWSLVEAKLKEADRLREAGAAQQAIDLCQEAISLDPQNYIAYCYLGDAYRELEEWETAQLHYQKSIALNPEFSLSNYYLGVVFSHLSKWELAVKYYQKAIELNVDVFWVYTHLGEAFLKLEKWSAAVEAYQKAIELNPNFGWNYHYLGTALAKVKRWEEAISASEKMLELNPDSCWTYAQLAGLFLDLKRWEDALKYYQKCIEINPDHCWFYYGMGEAYQKLERWDEALFYYEKSLEFEPNFWLYGGIGKIKKLQKKWSEAIGYLIEALKYEPGYYDAYITIGLILKEQGDLDGFTLCQYYDLPEQIIKTYLPDAIEKTIKSHQHSQVKYQLIYPSTVVNLQNSQTNDDRLIPGFELRDIVSPPAFVATVTNGSGWSCNLNTAVITSDRYLLADLSTGCSSLVVASNHLPSFTKIEGTVAFLAARWATNYYHWMFDIIARFDLLKKAGINLDDIDYFLVNQSDRPYHQETLKTLGIPLDKVITSHSHPYIQADQLIVPSHVTNDKPDNIAPWACQFLRQQFLPKPLNLDDRYQRIYITRGQSLWRQVVNEAELIDLLKKYQFTSVSLEKMSIRQQAECLASASVVIAPHGAGLTNIIFAQPGTKIIEIFSPNYPVNYYSVISSMCGFSHYYTTSAECINNGSDHNSGAQDMIVNLDQLLQVMQIAGVS